VFSNDPDRMMLLVVLSGENASGKVPVDREVLQGAMGEQPVGKIAAKRNVVVHSARQGALVGQQRLIKQHLKVILRMGVVAVVVVAVDIAGLDLEMDDGARGTKET
jgi:hypothetical protein